MKHDLQKMMAQGTLVMGILNLTPDSFSDGGLHETQEAAVARALKMIAQGAAIIDIGGESTRPGAEPVTVEEEIRRTAPVIAALKGRGAILSIDTRNPETMSAALAAGADMINDVTALTHNPESLEIAAHANVPVCLMHMKGTPQTMQYAPEYEDVVAEVLAYLLARAKVCMKAGIAKEKIIIDPGIGFGKTLAHNIALLANLERFVETGFPVLLGTSRKSFISAAANDQSPPENRLGGSLASALRGVEACAKILRVHDVHETVQALKVWKAIN